MSEIFRRIQYLLNRGRMDAELESDMEFHREMAERGGRSNFGDTLRLREDAREAWGWMWIDRLGQDLRYALRVLRNAPGFTLAAVLMLALGIGVNVAAFGFFNLIVLKPLPVRDPDTLLRFKRSAPERYAYSLPYQEMAFVRSHSKTLSAVLALNTSRLTMEGKEGPASVHFVTTNFFSELGAAPKFGRLLDATRDEGPDAPLVAVLSHGFWRSQFGSDPSAVGRTIRLNGRVLAIVGIAAEEFSGLSMDKPDLWAPLVQQPQIVTGSHLLTELTEGIGVRTWGRMQPGVTPQGVEQELRYIIAEFRQQHPAEIWEKESLASQPGGYAKSLMIGDRSGTGTEPADKLYPLAVLIGSLVFLILAAACSNLGGLLLARGVSREREISIRTAIGAGTGRLIRQLFTESVVLGLLGSVAGLGLGYLVLKLMMAWTGAPDWLDPSPDWPVAAFATGIGFVSAILFGLAPAIQVARQRQRSTFSKQVLIGAQVAASCVLLIVAGLLIRALDHALSASPGFEYEKAIAVMPGLGTHGYTPEQSRAYIDALKDRMRELPGVAAVSATATPPLAGSNVMVVGVTIEGRHLDVHWNRVDPGFLETMKIPIRAGRTLTSSDTAGILISESLARRSWPNENPLGKHFLSGEDATGAQVPYTVIGITRDARMDALEDPDSVDAYMLPGKDDLTKMAVVVRMSGSLESIVPAVSSIARSIDPRVHPRVQTLKGAFRQKMEGIERGTAAAAVLGASALLLACLGIVGLVAYAVSRKMKEIGIRMALGARPGHILSLVLMQFSRPVAAGLVLGIGGAAALSDLLRRQLFGISPLDPISYVAATALFLATVALAALVPARRALRVNPTSALRCD